MLRGAAGFGRVITGFFSRAQKFVLADAQKDLCDNAKEFASTVTTSGDLLSLLALDVLIKRLQLREFYPLNRQRNDKIRSLLKETDLTLFGAIAFIEFMKTSEDKSLKQGFVQALADSAWKFRPEEMRHPWLKKNNVDLSQLRMEGFFTKKFDYEVSNAQGNKLHASFQMKEVVELRGADLPTIDIFFYDESSYALHVSYLFKHKENYQLYFIPRSCSDFGVTESVQRGLNPVAFETFLATRDLKVSKSEGKVLKNNALYYLESLLFVSEHLGPPAINFVGPRISDLQVLLNASLPTADRMSHLMQLESHMNRYQKLLSYFQLTFLVGYEEDLGLSSKTEREKLNIASEFVHTKLYASIFGRRFEIEASEIILRARRDCPDGKKAALFVPKNLLRTYLKALSKAAFLSTEELTENCWTELAKQDKQTQTAKYDEILLEQISASDQPYRWDAPQDYLSLTLQQALFSRKTRGR